MSYQIIDTHVHVFPDAILERSMAALQGVEGVKAYGDGSLAGLRSSMKRAGIGCSLVLPVATKPRQFDSVNRFATSLNALPDVRSLGGIHPDCEDLEGRLDELAARGFRGVKLHPDYQGRDIEYEGYIKILEGCRKRGMIAVIHAGLDPAFPEHIHCPPDRSARVVKALTTGKPFIVLAHMGGVAQQDLAEEHLVGLPVYFDTSYVLDKIPREQLLRMIRTHGAEKILFATDSPWTDTAALVRYFDSLPLTGEERAAILHKNAEELFGF